jgi:hypothetical protein
MSPSFEVFQGVIAVFGGETFLQQNTAAGPVQMLIIRSGPGNLGDQIAAATAMFQAVVGTVQRFQGRLTNVEGQRAILVA